MVSDSHDYVPLEPNRGLPAAPVSIDTRTQRHRIHREPRRVGRTTTPDRADCRWVTMVNSSSRLVLVRAEVSNRGRMSENDMD